MTVEAPTGSGTTTEKYNYKTKVGLAIGAVAEISLSDALAFRTELNFTQKGGKYKTTQTLGGVTFTDESIFTPNYFEIPTN